MHTFPTEFSDTVYAPLRSIAVEECAIFFILWHSHSSINVLLGMLRSFPQV